MRDYSITKNGNEWWQCNVTDSHGRKSTNWFATKEQCRKQVLYIWENEMSPEDRQKAQDEAIRKMVDRDERNGKLY